MKVNILTNTGSSMTVGKASAQVDAVSHSRISRSTFDAETSVITFQGLRLTSFYTVRVHLDPSIL